MGEDLKPKIATAFELWPIEKFVPYANNSRVHSPEQIDQLVASILEFGFTNPILVDTAHGVVAGHGRLEAAKALGMDELPVVVLDHLSDVQRRAYIIADNRLALNANWDVDVLEKELQMLNSDGFELATIGLSDAELNELDATIRMAERAHSSLDSHPEQGDLLSAAESAAAPRPPRTEPAQTNREPQRHSEVRFVQLHFDLATHEIASAMLRKACQDYKVETNSEAVLAMLREKYDRKEIAD